MTTRREFLQYSAALGAYAGMQNLLPGCAHNSRGVAMPRELVELSGNEIALHIAKTGIAIDGEYGDAITVNGTIPGPLLRLREGQDVTIRVTNRLSEDTSIHWHGFLLPSAMDGVPGLSFAGIKPGETFTYHFRVQQSGTYWYHSHSRLQEQSGLYGPVVIEPAAGESRTCDRDYTLLFSDWTFENPYRILARLHKQAGYYNVQKPTLGGLVTDEAREQEGLWRAVGNRYRWGKMRMDPSDISDVTGSTYEYLVNGHSAHSNWTALFAPGEVVRLRLINGSSASFFDVRIPDLKMKVIAADGQNIEPVVVDELRIAIAETYDVIVEPKEDAHTIFAEAMDRSGCARATIATQNGLSAPVPKRRKRALRGMQDMGMVHGKDQRHGASDHEKMFHHGRDHHGISNSMVAEMAMARLHEPGIGLGNDGRRVLVYSDLRSATARAPARAPDREIELHLTGNMERYMWSFDGKKMSEVRKPIQLRYGERVRFVLVNDTMMEHPIHLHGMFFELENGSGTSNPLKHTVAVKPAEYLSFIVDANEPGLWAFHCHVLYHMEMGMMRVVEVKQEGEHATPT